MKAPAINKALSRWEELLSLSHDEAALEAARWDWYALLRLAQCAYPECPRIGYGLGLDQEPLRLGQPTFFHHPAMTIADFIGNGLPEKSQQSLNSDGSFKPSGPAIPSFQSSVRAQSTKPAARIYSHHLGLFGPFGPLPLHLTEFAHRRLRAADAAFFEFCNALTHRFLCFFFRAWAEGRKELTLDRPCALSAGQQAFARMDIAEHGEESWEFYLGSLIGCGLDSTRIRDRVPEEARIFYAGRLLLQTRNSEGLCAILGHYFSVPARLQEFQPRSLPIPESARWYLGTDRPTGRLGWSTLVGASILDYQSGFRIRLGPVSLSEFEQFFPDTEIFGQLHDWIRFYCGKETDPNPDTGIDSAWDLQLVLRASDVPKSHLGETSRLGLTTWLYSAPPDRDVDDLVLQPRMSA